MAKLLWVGENRDNKGGLSAKAYLIRRSGRLVRIRYGSVESVGKGGRVHWLTAPRVHQHRFSTEEAAASFLRRQTRLKETGGYDRLPGRVRVHTKRRRCSLCGY